MTHPLVERALKTTFDNAMIQTWLSDKESLEKRIKAIKLVNDSTSSILYSSAKD